MALTIDRLGHIRVLEPSMRGEPTDHLFLPSRTLDLHDDNIRQDVSLATLEEVNHLADQRKSLVAALRRKQHHRQQSIL